MTELINPFSDPNETGWNRVASARISATLGFLSRHAPKLSGRVLDIGGDSPMSREITSRFDVELTHTSQDCDLDFDDLPGSWDHIFSFEVIEHLGNPLRHLVQLRERLNPGGTIWLSTPLVTNRLRPTHWIRNKHHIFEMDRAQLFTLINRSGLTIDESTTCHYLPLYKNFLGVRTLIRFLTTRCILLKLRV
jgi:SAM-dependent methyltransferase